MSDTIDSIADIVQIAGNPAQLSSPLRKAEDAEDFAAFIGNQAAMAKRVLCITQRGHLQRRGLQHEFDFLVLENIFY